MSRLSPLLAGCRRVAGSVLVLLVVVPFWHVLSRQTGPVAREAVRLSESYASTMLQGTGLVLLVAATAALVLNHGIYETHVIRASNALASIRSGRYAAALGILASGLTIAASSYLWDFKPPLIDVMSQLIHARYFASGLAASPPDLPTEFWVVANTVVTRQGWLSQYPPGHVGILAVGFRLGAFWVITPLLMGTAAALTALVADRLMPRDRAVARWGAFLFAVSPFMIVIAAAHLSHVTAAAFSCVGAYCALRATDQGWRWALPAGAAVGAVFAARPLTAVTVGFVVTGGVWLTALPGRKARLRYLMSRSVAALVGAAPFGLAVAAFNAHFFGNPFRFGYLAYLGPNHGLGFHYDPWGNMYDPLDGLGYMSSDLSSLGYFLFRTPVSAVLVVGIFLVFARRLRRGLRLIAAWACVLVVPLAAYWHHDLMLGPRMLSDAAPAWALLAVAAGTQLVRWMPEDKVVLWGRFSPRVFVGSALLTSLAIGFGNIIPRAVRNYSAIFEGTATPPTHEPLLVFVHDGWSDRTVAKLLASGMRADSASVALARNSSCRMYEFMISYAGRRVSDSVPPLPPLEFGPAATDGSEPVRLSSGAVVRARPGEELSAECLRQANADRFGVVPLMPLLWQGDLPGLAVRGPMFVRDMGPTANATLMARYPARRPAVLLRRSPDRPPALVAYTDGMDLLWGIEQSDPSMVGETVRP